MYDGKYIKLHEFLKCADQNIDSFMLTFSQIEGILSFKLPASAYKYPAWWANDQRGTHSRSWMLAGWETTNVQVGQRITFVKQAVPGRIV